MRDVKGLSKGGSALVSTKKHSMMFLDHAKRRVAALRVNRGEMRSESANHSPHEKEYVNRSKICSRYVSIKGKLPVCADSDVSYLKPPRC